MCNVLMQLAPKKIQHISNFKARMFKPLKYNLKMQFGDLGIQTLNTIPFTSNSMVLFG